MAQSNGLWNGSEWFKVCVQAVLLCFSLSLWKTHISNMFCYILLGMNLHIHTYALKCILIENGQNLMHFNNRSHIIHSFPKKAE